MSRRRGEDGGSWLLRRRGVKMYCSIRLSSCSAISPSSRLLQTPARLIAGQSATPGPSIPLLVWQTSALYISNPDSVNFVTACASNTLSSKYVRPCSTRMEMYAGRVACCPLVSHAPTGQTDRRRTEMDGLTDAIPLHCVKF